MIARERRLTDLHASRCWIALSIQKQPPAKAPQPYQAIRAEQTEAGQRQAGQGKATACRCTAAVLHALGATF